MKTLFIVVLACWFICCCSAFDIDGLTLSIPDVKSREEQTALEDEILTRREELLANLSALLEPMEDLMMSGFPTIESTEDKIGSDTGTESVGETSTPQEDVTEDVINVREETHTEGQVDETTNRIYIGYVKDKAGEISGMCASRVHPGIMYYVNDRSIPSSDIYAVDIDHGCKVVSTIRLSVTKGDWEDLACGPCNDGTDSFCIYISDDGYVDGVRLSRIYKIKEPDELVEEQNYQVQSHEIIDYTSSLDNVQTLMVTPTGRIFVMDTTEDDFYLYEIVNKKAVRLFDVGIWTYHEGPRGGDITPDGKGWTFKMLDRVYYFYVEDESDMEYILSDSDFRQKLPYYEEYYGTALAWTSTGGSFVTCSEGTNEPWYRYYRLN